MFMTSFTYAMAAGGVVAVIGAVLAFLRGPEQETGRILLSDFADFVPANMGVLSHLESFGPENLFEKINAKSELYLRRVF